jgi:hypothetical protein
VDKQEERGPLEPVECPLIRKAWEETEHNWTADVEKVFNKSTPTAQPAEKPSNG